MKEVIKLSKSEDKEILFSPREKLLSLEKEGIFVFHGSPDEIETLEPRQPFIYNVQSKKNRKHGDPCVSATPFADIAIFRAIVNSKNFSRDEYASRFGVNRNGKMELATTKPVLEKVKGQRGFVHVLNKSSFHKFSNMEWRARETVKPEEVILVTEEDLPLNIQIIDKDFNPNKKSG